MASLMTSSHFWESNAFQWVMAECETILVQPRVYFHRNSPSYGQFWMRNMISFDKLRITNAKFKSENHFVLQSMHKYQPRIHFLEVNQLQMTHNYKFGHYYHILFQGFNRNRKYTASDKSLIRFQPTGNHIFHLSSNRVYSRHSESVKIKIKRHR